ncbi:MAG: ABC transporter permease [Tannerella sp.]|jgi:putative ABC transport system permease protein|nr:ABC transporter permease [Tannerella sp.]
MFEFDNLHEIWSTVKKNKLRTFLTGFAIAWGIFMLIILLASGNGLRNGIAYNFRYMADNTVYCWSRYTTKPYRGFQPDRQIEFTEKDLLAIKREHPEVDLISGRNFRNDTLTYNREYLIGGVQAVHSDYASILYTPILSGRFINELDIMERRKVIVLPPRTAEILFRDSVKPLGQFVKLGSLMFQIVGIYEEQNNNDSPPAFIPFTTGQSLYDGGHRIHELVFTLKGINTEAESEAFEARFRERMARRHQFDPTDMNPVGMYNSGNEFRMWQGMNNGIALFVWIIGIGTLMAGIVGVSNIMLISVRERTKEFGIRKAIGAKPSSILRLIIVESILVTAVFGYFGMVSGIGLTELINYVMEMSAAASGGGGGTEDTTVFHNPTVDMGTALAATGVLIVAGVLAGYFPARKAVKISAVEAMRME